MPATTSSARRRGRAEPSDATQWAAVMTSRGETTTAPQVWPASVSLAEASMSAAANGQRARGGLLSADHGARGESHRLREPHTPRQRDRRVE